MKNYIRAATVLLLVLSVSLTALQRIRMDSLKKERDAYKATSVAMLQEAEHYKTENGLNAARVREMQLTLKEYEKYRREDAAVIAQLKIDKRDIRQIINSQTKTSYELEAKAADTVYVDGADTVRCVEYSGEWLDFSGCFDGRWNFSGTVRSRDELVYIEHVTPKRFLGFLWRTRAIKKREQEIVSKNPHTEIIGVEFVTIRK